MTRKSKYKKLLEGILEDVCVPKLEVAIKEEANHLYPLRGDVFHIVKRYLCLVKEELGLKKPEKEETVLTIEEA